MKEKTPFPLFQSHLDLAHQYWEKLCKKHFWSIDATCGNGHDTVFLSQISSEVIAIDIQKEALENTKNRLLASNISLSRVSFFCQNHESFPQLAYEYPIQLIVYNLGYLPGSNKKITTRVESTLQSLTKALHLIRSGGGISITCYPRHFEGAREQEAILHLCERLDPRKWNVCFHQWKNRKDSPSFLLIQKISI